MQVFNAFLRVLNKHKGQMIMYLCIFTGILSAFCFSGNSGDDSYSSKQVKFAVFDYDKSTQSEALIDYLSDNQKLVTIKADEKEVIQDELFARNVACVLRIKEGYGESVNKGIHDKLEVVTIPDTLAAMNFESSINEYESTFSSYISAGYSVDDAVKSTVRALDEEVDVSTPEGGETTGLSRSGQFFVYLGYVLIVMCIVGVTPVLQVFMKKELKNRIQCSSYNYLMFNKELLLGVLSTGGIISLVILFIYIVMPIGNLFTVRGGLFVINMLCYMLVSLALSFMISKATSNDEIISMVANILSLGMAFLSGVFVPMELLSDSVIRIAHFLPTYWYATGVYSIDKYSGGSINEIAMSFGVQLLFAAAIAVVALVLDRKLKPAVEK